jgi:outer membrane protein
MAVRGNLNSSCIASGGAVARRVRRPAAAVRGMGRSLVTCVLLLSFGAFSSSAQGETLKDALASAYLFNPQLKAQRAGLRGADENVARARSGYRPKLAGQVDHSVQDSKFSPDWQNQSGTSHPRSYMISLDQPIFRGFRTVNAVRGAEAAVEAGREDLRAVEQQVLLGAVQSYMDVVRDLAIVSFRENYVKAQAEKLKSTSDRFGAGEVTATDVAQAEAALSGGQSDLALSRAMLQVSRANFERVIGRAPNHVAAPNPIDRLLPKSSEDARKVAEAENPAIIAALYRERATDRAIDEVRGELLPQVSLQASYAAAYNPIHGTSEQDTGIVTGHITVPLYQAGEVGARIRQKVEERSQAKQLIDLARQQVQASVASAWSQMVAVRVRIGANKALMSANSKALEGVIKEEYVGQRTVLDALNAQLALLNSRILLEGSKRDLVVFSYALLASMGRLTAADLGLNVAQYDPSKHYNDVKDKWSDWDWSSRADWAAQVVPADEVEVGPLGVPANGRRNPNGPARQE